jgi:hypothetical protein
VKGSGFSGNTQQQQQPQYFPQEIGRMPQPNMMGMQRMPGGHKIGPQNPMQQQQQPPLYMNQQQQQQNMFPQQNRGESIFARIKNKTYAVFLLQTCKLRTTAAAFCCSSFFRANAPSTRSIWPSSSHMVGVIFSDPKKVLSQKFSIICGAGGARPLRGQHGDGNNPNSLSQWFSGAGQMGAMPPIPTANTFSVEELERRQQTSTATPVHN